MLCYAMFKERALLRAEPMEEVYGQRPQGLPADECVQLLFGVWRLHRQQQTLMLQARFREADKNSDGELTLGEFHGAMRMTAPAEGAAAETFRLSREARMARETAEEVFNEVLEACEALNPLCEILI